MELGDSIVLYPHSHYLLKKLTNDEEGRGSLACKGTFENGGGGVGGGGWGIGDVLLEFGIGTPFIHLPHLKEPKTLPV